MVHARTDDAPGKATSLGISTFEAIKKDILYAELRPGEQLRLRVLCDRYGCGASPIREALSQLASHGWVVRLDRRGFFVALTSEAEFQDILMNRCFLETEALRRSIASGDSTWEEEVLLAHFRLGRVPRFGSAEDTDINRDWEHAHKTFHMALISACGSPILAANCEKLYDLNIRYRFQSRRKSRRTRTVSTEHDALKDLVLARRADDAVEALERHYLKTGSFLFEAQGNAAEVSEG
ncbi:GntR family transcriptional regulator [Roseitranquillus sediminis]|uniref:GntR family transcriptional regulator n=1 Tax=Roseitranquillus sediminis TaxID=2809051 RepID=UPI001D0CCE52|nr:GntR family transcriptional regulator [Roseitranquillus sediminis]MBM9593555.1 FCD domain-containing protein [Roseitranquillus sediminis]